MSELEAVYTVWLREMIRYFRAKERIIGSLAMPIFWLLIFGSSMRTSVSLGINLDYTSFIAPGVIAMTIMFTSMFSGISVIWDRELGFMKEMLVAPVSRISIVTGKSLGGATTALIQGILVLSLSFILGVRINMISLLIIIPIIILIALGLVGIGVAIASLLESMEGFQLIMNFIIMPMFFLSGALFPINNLPDWLKVISYIDPVTYDVELLRYVMTGFSNINVMLSFIIVLGFTCSTLLIGAYLFNKRS